MELFPAIDLLDGHVVRLARGDYDEKTVYGDDPVAVARSFEEQGARWIHVVDLDAARGDEADNRESIARIAREVGIGIEVGGGMRSLPRLEAMAEAGVKRLVLGTALARDPEFAREAIREFGSMIVAGVDAKGGNVAVQGWTEDSGLDALEFVSSLADIGIGHLVYTEVERDGMGTGIDHDLYRRVARAAGFPVVASGGIASLEDIGSARDLGDDVLEGIITGRALYEGAFTVEQAVALLARKERP